VNPSEFLTVAQNLYPSMSEAERRTSIGRSYYALYNQLVMALSKEGVQFDGVDSHARLVYYLSQCSPQKAPTIGADLKTLRNYRNDADYEMGKSIGKGESEFAYKKAHAAVQKFAGLNKSDVTKIADCIRYLPPFNSPRRRP